MQSKYVRLQIRGRLQVQPSTCTKYACTSLALAFGLQNDKYVVFVNWDTPASPFYRVFWRKGGRSSAFNASRWCMVLTRYHLRETWANWKSLRSQEPRTRFTKLKCGPFAIFQGHWSTALKLGNVWGLLCAPIEQSLPPIAASFLCRALPLLSQSCFWPSSISLAKTLCILLGICSLISPAINLNPASDAQYPLNFKLSPEPFPMPDSFSTVQILFRSRAKVEKERGSKHQLCC